MILWMYKMQIWRPNQMFFGNADLFPFRSNSENDLEESFLQRKYLSPKRSSRRVDYSSEYLWEIFPEKFQIYHSIQKLE